MHVPCIDLLAVGVQINSDLPALLDEWATSLFRELDYTREARNGIRFRELYRHLEAWPTQGLGLVARVWHLEMTSKARMIRPCRSRELHRHQGTALWPQVLGSRHGPQQTQPASFRSPGCRVAGT